MENYQKLEKIGEGEQHQADSGTQVFEILHVSCTMELC